MNSNSSINMAKGILSNARETDTFVNQGMVSLALAWTLVAFVEELQDIKKARIHIVPDGGGHTVEIIR